jgi:predicted nucleotide-binding protein
MASSARESADETILISRSLLDEELSARIGLGKQLTNDIRDADYTRWHEFFRQYRIWDEVNETLLRRSFQTSAQRDLYLEPVDDGSDTRDLSPEGRENSLVSAIEEKARRLGSLKERLRYFNESGELPPAQQSAIYSERNTDRSAKSHPNTEATDVFVVHGHNDAIKDRIARYLARITGREPIILHEQPNMGRTVIEKFEDYAEKIGFAVILLTADDKGHAITSPEANPRARQNVILELGFFIGTLGRSRVAVLHEEAVELPSDISGLLYTSLGSEWRLDLARELKASGMRVDMDKIV